MKQNEICVKMCSVIDVDCFITIVSQFYVFIYNYKLYLNFIYKIVLRLSDCVSLKILQSYIN